MDAGAKDRMVTIQQLTESTGASGFPIEAWTTLTTEYFVSKEEVGGRERFIANQLTSPYDTRWKGAYRTDLDPDVIDVPKKRRLVYKGRNYDIVSASVMGRNDGIELLTLARNG